MSALFESPGYETQHWDVSPALQIGAAELAASARIKRIKADETLYVEGESAPHCYQVVSGYIKEYNTLEDGRRQITDFYDAGDMFGLSGTRDHHYTAEAVVDSVVRYYPREILARASASPELSRYFFDMLVNRLNRSREQVIMIGRMNAAQRVAAFLYHLFEARCGAGEIDLPMSRQDIADHLGLTTETVCRSLTELKKKRFIVMPTARQFSVLDEEKLADVARGASTLL